MSEEKIVMRDSDEAARYMTGIKGWVSRDGRYFGDNNDSESIARYAGCTHVACKKCDRPTEKHRLICRACSDLEEEKRFAAMPRAEWDGKAMLYSMQKDEYYSSPGEAEDSLEEDETLADLQLVICTPNYVRRIDSEDVCGDLMPDDDSDVPDEIFAAIEAFNAAVKDIVLSWSPGKTALRV